MDDVLREMALIIGSYIGVIVIGFALMNFLSGGFLIKFLRVKASRGKLILIKVKSVTDHYYKAGLISEKSLKYKARGQKEKKNITIPDGEILYRSMGCWCVDVDEETNEVITVWGEKIDTYDAEKYEQLVIRALYTPALMDKNEKIMLLLLIACILGLAIVFFYVKSIDENLLLVTQRLANLNTIASSSVGVVS